MAIIDLDHFKAVNDRCWPWSRATPCSLLSAACWQRIAARATSPCRYGGEEFCLLLPRTDAATAQRKVSHLLALWRQQRFEIEGDSLSGLSFSAGISDSIRAPLSPHMLLQAADQQLLAAKQRGRSRVLALGLSEKTAQ